MNDSDEILMERCARGGMDGEEAFRELHDRYAARVLGFLIRMLGARVRAEELAQEVWLSVWTRSNSFQRTRTFRPWLFGIAAHRAIDDLRRKSPLLWSSFEPEQNSGNSTSPLELADGESTPDQLAVLNELRHHLRDCIDALPAPFRAVCMLVYVEGLSFKDAAAVLEIPLGTVQSRSIRLLGRLRSCLIRKGLVD